MESLLQNAMDTFNGNKTENHLPIYADGESLNPDGGPVFFTVPKKPSQENESSTESSDDSDSDTGLQVGSEPKQKCTKKYCIGIFVLVALVLVLTAGGVTACVMCSKKKANSTSSGNTSEATAEATRPHIEEAGMPVPQEVVRHGEAPEQREEANSTDEQQATEGHVGGVQTMDGPLKEAIHKFKQTDFRGRSIIKAKTQTSQKSQGEQAYNDANDSFREKTEELRADLYEGSEGSQRTRKFIEDAFTIIENVVNIGYIDESRASERVVQQQLLAKQKTLENIFVKLHELKSTLASENGTTDDQSDAILEAFNGFSFTTEAEFRKGTYTRRVQEWKDKLQTEKKNIEACTETYLEGEPYEWHRQHRQAEAILTVNEVQLKELVPRMYRVADILEADFNKREAMFGISTEGDDDLPPVLTLERRNADPLPSSGLDSPPNPLDDGGDDMYA